jgi:O-antigen ligase
VVKAAQGSYVLAVLWPLAAVAAVREARAPWLVLPMAAGVVAGGLGLAADAPLAAIVVSAVTAAVVWRWPRLMPRIAAAKAGVLFLAAPAILWAARATGLFAAIQPATPLSWSQRMDYWRHAGDWIGDRPFRGWGLDASRMFSPGIHLHPHDAALQVWLELGLIGAVAAALFWGILFLRLGRDRPDLAAAGGAAAAAAYLIVGAVSFGVWQDWWLAVGALAATAYAALQPSPSPAESSRSSTLPPFSE